MNLLPKFKKIAFITIIFCFFNTFFSFQLLADRNSTAPHITDLLDRLKNNPGFANYFNFRCKTIYILEINDSSLSRAHLTKAGEFVQKILQENQFLSNEIAVENETIIVKIADNKSAQQASALLKNRLQNRATFSEVGLQYFHIVDHGNEINITPDKAWITPLIENAIEQSTNELRLRLTSIGIEKFWLKRLDRKHLALVVCEPKNLYDLASLIAPAKMTFHLSPDNVDVDNPPQGISILTGYFDKNRRVAVDNHTVIEANIVSATYYSDPQVPDRYIVRYRLDKNSANDFTEMTRQNSQKTFALVLNKKVLLTPFIVNMIPGDRGEISNIPNEKAAILLATILQASSNPLPLMIRAEWNIEPRAQQIKLTASLLSVFFFPSFPNGTLLQLFLANE